MTKTQLTSQIKSKIINMHQSEICWLMHGLILQESCEMQFPLLKLSPEGLALLCLLSLYIPASHKLCSRNIYSGPFLLLRAKMDTWHTCLDLSLRPAAEQQTNVPLKVSKPRSGLLYRYLITYYDCGILVFLICIHGHDLYRLRCLWW